MHQAGATGHALFWGGYEDAERGIYLFYPDYMDEESARLSAPLALLRAHKSRSDTLTHRDYLGALGDFRSTAASWAIFSCTTRARTSSFWRT